MLCVKLPFLGMLTIVRKHHIFVMQFRHYASMIAVIRCVVLYNAVLCCLMLCCVVQCCVVLNPPQKIKNLIFEKTNFFFSILKISLKVLFIILKKKYFFQKLNVIYLFFKNIFENNFYMVKRELPAEKDTIFYLYVT